jgi:hypothetical protein
MSRAISERKTLPHKGQGFFRDTEVLLIHQDD